MIKFCPETESKGSGGLDTLDRKQSCKEDFTEKMWGLVCEVQGGRVRKKRTLNESFRSIKAKHGMARLDMVFDSIWSKKISLLLPDKSVD